MGESLRVLVLGAGPAGLSAALAAAQNGAAVTLVDALPEPGGQIWRGLWNKPDSGPADDCFRELRSSSVTLRLGRRAITGSTMNEGGPPGHLAASASPLVLPHVMARQSPATTSTGSLGLIGPDGPENLAYDRLVLATGARERFLPFPGWTLPGVLGAGGLQGLVKGGLEVRGKRVVVAGSGPLLLAVAAHLRDQGARVIAVAEQASNRAIASLIPGLLQRPRLLLQSLSFAGLPLRANTWVRRVEGDDKLQRVHLQTPSGTRILEADLLACGFGLLPNLDLANLLGCRVLDGAVAADALQRTSLPGIFAAGESTGIGGVDKALVEGRIAGFMAVDREAEAQALVPSAERIRDWGRALERAYALRPELRELPDPSTILCRCENVPVGAVQTFTRGRDARLHGRCGMGRCQGRTCGPAAEFLFGWAPGGPRQPLVPTTFADLVGALSQPEQP